MKNRFVLIPLFILGIMVTGCNKPDTIQPVVTLLGDYEQFVSLNGTYVESGATAMDNEDGDISSDVIITGNVNVNQTGEYKLFYDVEDAEGNKASTAKRYVHVVNDVDYMIGTYLAEPNCVGTSTYSSYNTIVTTSETSNNEIYIKRVMWSVEDEPVLATVSGTAVSIPLQTIGDSTVEGYGTITGTSFILTVTINGFFTYDCTIDHTKL